MAARDVRCRAGHVVAELAREFEARVRAEPAAAPPRARAAAALDDLGVTCLACRVHLQLGRDMEARQVREATEAFLEAEDARAAGLAKRLPERGEHSGAEGMRSRCLQCYRPSVLLRRDAAGTSNQTMRACATCSFHVSTRMRLQDRPVVAWYC